MEQKTAGDTRFGARASLEPERNVDICTYCPTVAIYFSELLNFKLIEEPFLSAGSRSALYTPHRLRPGPFWVPSQNLKSVHLNDIQSMRLNSLRGKGILKRRFLEGGGCNHR